MALSKEERALLKNARTLIGNGNETFICFALASSALDMNMCGHDRRLKDYINRKLEGYSTLSAWQEHKHKHGDRQSAQQLRASRIAWITWMLGE